MSKEAVDKATKIQKLAARPDRSVSLRASAGSGKTKVLVDRFVRLCVEGERGGTDPRAILAITFTRKAAVEIQQRLLERARELALSDEAQLRATLADLCGRTDSPILPAELEAAAGLYEKILEDVSGLSVGTIHSFCQAILGRFAAEAGLDPHAVVLDNTDDLVDEALDQLEREIAADPVLAAAAQAAGKDPASVRLALREMYGHRLRLDRWAHHLKPLLPDSAALLPPLHRAELLDPMLGQVSGELFAGLDLPQGDPRPGLLEAMGQRLDVLLEQGLDRVWLGLGADLPKAQAKSLEKSRETQRQKLASLRECWGAAAPEDRGQLVLDLKEIFLTKQDTPRVWSRVKNQGLGELFNQLFLEEARPLLDLIRRWGYLDLLDANAHLLRLALRLMDICDELKRRDQVMDFQDLEDFAVRLMADKGRALSLLYRLDDSISHILLDEFQDTNFNQWDVLVTFVEEFLSGGSDPDQIRTVFVVGDVKQSIYGFRGAEPELFGRVTALLKRFEQTTCELPTNFRSTGAVVDAVGCLFTSPPLRDVLPPGELKTVWQQHARSEDPGPVVVLDPFTTEEEESAPGGDQQAAAVAARLARDLVDTRQPTWERVAGQVRERPLNWSDLLVLCRSRTEIAVYEKAFRDAGIPVAAAGRGTLAASREVQDVLALLRWLIYPEDDLALSTVLRSPIFRLTEADFQRVLALRGLHKVDSEGKRLPPARLWQSIRKLIEDPELGAAVELLRSWRKHVGLESCHDLLRRVYREGGLPERYEAAGGVQARQNLLRLFDLALAPEVASTPTVRQLVEVIDRAARLSAEEEAVTPPDQEQGRVRFMTIHGAKGLEAPVVFLVDADRKLGKQDLYVRLVPEDNRTPLVFKVDKKFREGFRGAGLDLSSVERAAAWAEQQGGTEDANLLYVAMTRARDRLFVLGGEKCTQEGNDSFLRQLIRSAAAGECSTVDRNDPPWLDRGTPLPEPTASPGDETAAADIITGRPWTPPVLPPLVRTVTPSALEPDQDAGPEEASTDEGTDRLTELTGNRQEAIDRGNAIHLLLQQAADTGVLPDGDSEQHAEARAVFENPELGWVFQPEKGQGRGLSEVAVIHRQPRSAGDAEESRVTGIIDRLVLRPGRADIIDYKTNRLGDDPAKIQQLAEHYRPQLAAYRRVIGSLYPDRVIGTWLLFTEPAGGRLQEVT